MILCTFTRFSPGVHPISLSFYSILASKFTIFRGFCIMCAFCVHTKKMTHYFLQTWHVVSISFSERTAIAVVCTLGHPEVVGESSKMSQKYCIFYTQNQPNFCWFQIVVFILTIGTDWMMKKMKSFQILVFQAKSWKFLDNSWFAHIRHKMVDIPMSKISHERQGKLFEGTILQTLKFVPAFLPSHYLSYSLRYDFMKINIYMIHQRLNVLKVCL